jgi:hypothetical protein
MSNNSHDDPPGTTKGSVNAETPMPMLNSPNPGNDPFLNHPVIPTTDNTGGIGIATY